MSAIAGVVLLIDLVLVGAFWWAASVDTSELRLWLASVGPLWLAVLLLLIVWLLYLSGRPWLRSITDLSRNERIAYLVLTVLLFAIVVLVVPRTSLILFDEQIYQNIAQTIVHEGKALMVNIGEAELGEYRSIETEYNKQPIGHPFYISVFFGVLGVSERVAHAANNYAYLILIFSVAALGFAITRSTASSLWALALVGSTPMVMIWAGTVSAEVTAAAFSAFGFLTAYLYGRRPGWIGGLLFALSAGWSTYFRPESLLLLGPMVMMPSLLAPRELLKPRFYVVGLVLVLAVLPELLHLYAVQGERWGSSGEKFALEHFREIVAVNGPFYWKNERYPLLFTCLAVFGLVAPKWRWEKLVIFLWFLISWGIFLFFYAGSYNYGNDVRFSVLSAAPLALLGSLGAKALIDLSWGPIKRGALLVPLAVIVLVWWSGFFEMIRSAGPKAGQAKRDIDVSREFVEYVPEGSFVFSQVPSIWLVRGVNAGQASFLSTYSERVRRDFFRRYPGGIYFYRGFWCVVPDRVQRRLCRQILEGFRHDIAASVDTPEGTFTLYRLYPEKEGDL